MSVSDTWPEERLAQVFATFPTDSVPPACANPHCRNVQRQWNTTADTLIDPSIIVQRTIQGYTVLAGRQRTCVAKRAGQQTLPARIFGSPVAQSLAEVGQPSTWTTAYTWQPDSPDPRPHGSVLGYYTALARRHDGLANPEVATWGFVSIPICGLPDYRIHPESSWEPRCLAPGLHVTMRTEPESRRWRPKRTRRERVVCTLTIDAPAPLGKIWIGAFPRTGDWIHGYRPDSASQTVLLRRRYCLDPDWLAKSCQ